MNILLFIMFTLVIQRDLPVAARKSIKTEKWSVLKCRITRTNWCDDCITGQQPNHTICMRNKFKNLRSYAINRSRFDSACCKRKGETRIDCKFTYLNKTEDNCFTLDDLRGECVDDYTLASVDFKIPRNSCETRERSMNAYSCCTASSVNIPLDVDSQNQTASEGLANSSTGISSLRSQTEAETTTDSSVTNKHKDEGKCVFFEHQHECQTINYWFLEAHKYCKKLLGSGEVYSAYTITVKDETRKCRGKIPASNGYKVICCTPPEAESSCTIISGVTDKVSAHSVCKATNNRTITKYLKGDEDSVSRYTCCDLNVCSRMLSDAFPTTYHFEETRYRGSNVDYKAHCRKGYLERTCSKRGKQAEWGVETNHGCKTPETVMNDAIRDMEIGTRLPGDDTDEVGKYVEIIGNVVELAVENKTIAKKMLSVVGNLMNMNEDVMLRAEKESSGGGHRVVSIIENFTSQLEITNGVSNVVTTKDITVGAYNIDRLKKPLVVEGIFREDDTVGQAEESKGPTVTIPLDILATLRKKNHKIEIIAYSNPKLFLNSKSVGFSNNYSVISILVKYMTSFKKNQTVVTYKIPRDKDDNRNFTCAFWNTQVRNWSSKGIEVTTDKNGDKICRATHLTSFCVLMDTDPSQRLSEVDERYLTYISYIGCGISVVGLIITILTYGLFRTLHGEKSGKILLNICVSMLLLNTIFLLGSLDSESYALNICMAVAVALHYFLLTTLVWMMIEALNMYQMLIIVFSEGQQRFMRTRLMVGWGLPLVVVGVTMAVSLDNYKPNNQFCFLSHTNQAAFFAAVLAPACLILFINTYVFIRVSLIVLRRSKLPTDLSGTTSAVSITQVRGAMSVMIVLGVTWILGPIAIGPAKVVFAYMFTILNSIQGFLVFLFRCVFYGESRLSWKHLFSTGRLKRRRGDVLSSSAWTTETRKRTKKYTADSASVSDSSFESSSISNMPGTSGETGANITSESDYYTARDRFSTKYKPESPTAQDRYMPGLSPLRESSDTYGKSLTTVGSKSEHKSRQKPKRRRGASPRDSCHTDYKRKYNNDDTATQSVETPIENDVVKSTDSALLPKMVPSWFGGFFPTESALRKEAVKMKKPHHTRGAHKSPHNRHNSKDRHT